MFKHLITYRIADSFIPDFSAVSEALQKTPFVAIGATQEKSEGWTPPRGEEHGAMAEAINGQWVMRLMTETKSIPASVLNRKVQEKADAIEQATGRKPGKREKKELKDEAKLDLLPMAFTKQGGMWIWLDPQAKRLYIDTGSQARADVAVTLLVDALPGFAVALLDTQTSAQAAMAHWLVTQEPPPGFSVDRHCKLRASDESKATINYSRHPLDTDEIKGHVEHGKLPVELALTYDDRVSFVLTEALQIKKIEYIDLKTDSKGEEGGFDADVTLATAELSALIPALIEALGGEGRTELGQPVQMHPTDTTASFVSEVAMHLRGKGFNVSMATGRVTGPRHAPADTDSASAPFDV